VTAAVSTQATFREAYAGHRAEEGRAYGEHELLALPYLASGTPALVRQWAVRARTFDAFVRRVLSPASRRQTQPLDLLDVGAGNGWLSHRATQLGCRAVAVDFRDDAVDGLRAAKGYGRAGAGRFGCIAGSFEALPLMDSSFDVAVFNASLHYATDLGAALREVRRTVRRGGRIAVLDSPFYRSTAAGEAMIAEKRRNAARDFGARAEALLALPFIEYLTRDRMADASAGLGLSWRHHRVFYPLWYESRALLSWLHRRRSPSRFDLWEATVA
jgi:SAM-dependent methyltransferase